MFALHQLSFELSINPKLLVFSFFAQFFAYDTTAGLNTNGSQLATD